ncbi:MAG: hypothetical protein HQK55_03695, partial [Deltaproteobacteria bacterium]|nr:hypothetical protein [Deltaproteobacteria bacterium]
LLRLNLSWPDREEVYLAADQRTMVMIGDQAMEADWPQPPLLFRLLLYNETSKLTALVKAHQVNLDNVVLGKDAGNQSVITLGALVGDRKSPQIQITENSRHLVRLILPATENLPGYDVLLSDYHRHSPGVDWPGRLRVINHEGAAMDLILKSLTINSELERETFDLEEIKQMATPAVAPPPSFPDPALFPILNQIDSLKTKLDYPLKPLL